MKPMLSATCDDTKLLTYPLMASPKLDGIRAIVDPELGLVSRNLKPIRNIFTRDQFSTPFLEGLDGELILGAHDATVFRRTTSAVSAFEGCPDVTLWVFDVQGVDAGFQERYEYLMSNVHSRFTNVRVVPHQFIKNHVELAVYEESCLSAGYEGVMVRSLDGAYKEGRATVRAISRRWPRRWKRSTWKASASSISTTTPSCPAITSNDLTGCWPCSTRSIAGAWGA